MKIIVSIILLLLGFCVFLFWLSGSHGHIRLRPHMAEDWVMASLILICLLVPVFLLLSWYRQKKK
jgi:hypothetical protein